MSFSERSLDAASLPSRRTAQRLHVAGVVVLLAAAGVLAVTSLVQDSCTFDETSHLTAGAVYLKTGDLRFAPDHPPLAKIWCAAPVLLAGPRWLNADPNMPAANPPGWDNADVFEYGRTWLFEQNEGQRLLVRGRCMMVVLLLATCLATYALARTLFGPSAGLLALALAALSPTMLAHGRLVTTDMPITLMTVLTLLAFARLAERITWPRLLAAGLALAAASVTKFSWPLLVPAIAVMAATAVWRAQPLELALTPRRRTQRATASAAGRTTGLFILESRLARTLAFGGPALFVIIVVWGAIWLTYGCRHDVQAPLSSADAANPIRRAAHERTAAGLALGWHNTLYKPNGEPLPGWTLAALRGLTAARLLPDAYLLGLSHTLASAQARPTYMLGEWSVQGWPAYFPLAFALKTPLATLALLLAGVVALARGRLRPRHHALYAGVLVFAATYGGYSLLSHLNIGERHLLPLYPLVFAFAGAAIVSARRFAGKAVLGALLAWLAAANLRCFPNYLAYFNEVIPAARLAGSRLTEPYQYLADSNLDWGQDLLRLRDWAARRQAGQPKLAYFGSAPPTYYLPCAALPSYMAFAPRAPLTAGTYVVSATQLLGIYDSLIRDPTGRSAWPGELERLSPDERRAHRLIAGLRGRPPDERITPGLFAWRLSDEDVRTLTREPGF